MWGVRGLGREWAAEVGAWFVAGGNFNPFGRFGEGLAG